MAFNSGLRVGDIITNKKITEIFKGNSQYGMSRSLKNNTLVLRSKLSSSYNDRWANTDHTKYYYTGMGLRGDQRLDYSQNKTLSQSRINNIDVFLFIGSGGALFTYMGRVILNDEPFQEEQVDADGILRKVWIFPLKLIESRNIKVDLEDEDDIKTNELEFIEDTNLKSIDKRATVENPPPKDKIVPPNLPKFKGKKTDFDKKNRIKKIIGDKGELFIIEYEKNKLSKLGMNNLSDLVENVSKTRGDGIGYDIKSYDEKGNEIFIEVKTTTESRRKPFNVSLVELERSKVDSDKYFLYRIYNFNLKKLSGTIYIIKGSIEENFNCHPVEYKAYREIY
jgi:hypothetical protein